jgi:arylsulfatase A-like enzyme
VIDTLRADRLSCYGNPRPASGAIDRLARQGVLFAETIAPAPLTQPSVATILTGLYPAAAGVINHPNRLEEDRSTLAEILRDAGYKTAFANPHPLLTPAWGFDRGWHEYRYLHKPSRFEASLLADLLRRLRLRGLRVGYQADTVTDFAVEVLSRNRSKPFFLYAHYLDPHFPYVPPRPFDRLFANEEAPRLLDKRLPDGRRRIFSIEASQRQMEETVALYDAEIAFTSREISRLLSTLDRLGLSDRTLVALTADHGESLGEQGLFFAHTHYLYDPTQHVPLILRFPDRFPRGTIVEAQAGLADLAPTLLDAAGIRPSMEMEGRSLLPLLRGEETEGRFAFAENGRTIARSGEEENPRWLVEGDAGKWRMIRADGWKLIRIPTPSGSVYELYDLTSDPGETTNLADRRTDIMKRLLAPLEEWRLASESGSIAETEIDEETLEGLRSLGYVQ